jgi:hypothetical protein
MEPTREIAPDSVQVPVPASANGAARRPVAEPAPKRGRQQERSQMSTSRLLAAAAELFA